MPSKEAVSGKAIRRMFLHEKPFLLLKIIATNDGDAYSAMVAKKIDCSYAYIIKLIKRMTALGLITSGGSSHKKLLKLTPAGRKIYKLISDI